MTEQITELKQRLVVGRKRDGRYCYDPQAKRELIEACLQPGISVAKLAVLCGHQQQHQQRLSRWCQSASVIRRSRCRHSRPGSPMVFDWNGQYRRPINWRIFFSCLPCSDSIPG